MAKSGFDKFINKAPTGAKKKEMFRAEKRKVKSEARAHGEEKRREKWEKERGIAPSVEKKTTDSEKKTFDKKETTETEHKPRFGRRPFIKKDAEEGADATQSASKKEGQPKEKRFSKRYITSNSDKYFKGDANLDPSLSPKPRFTEGSGTEEEMPLNKFVAYCGICGRREAAELVKKGDINVNGDIVYEPGYKVLKNDVILYKGKKLFLKKNLVYILLNKPKDYITTASDPEGRKTVMDLIKNATKERVYPVGRLDRNTTGVLLLTNDGELAQKLTHPAYQIKKVYAVKLDKPLTKRHFENIVTGIPLEDGTVHADTIAYADANDKSQVGIEIHTGKNRIVRRMFEHLGYEVKVLDRVLFGNLTKKNVERGRWRFLLEKEVRLLKYMNQSFLKRDHTKELKDYEETEQTELE